MLYLTLCDAKLSSTKYRISIRPMQVYSVTQGSAFDMPSNFSLFNVCLCCRVLHNCIFKYKIINFFKFLVLCIYRTVLVHALSENVPYKVNNFIKILNFGKTLVVLIFASWDFCKLEFLCLDTSGITSGSTLSSTTVYTTTLIEKSDCDCLNILELCTSSIPFKFYVILAFFILYSLFVTVACIKCNKKSSKKPKKDKNPSKKPKKTTKNNKKKEVRFESRIDETIIDDMPPPSPPITTLPEPKSSNVIELPPSVRLRISLHDLCDPSFPPPPSPNTLEIISESC